MKALVQSIFVAIVAILIFLFNGCKTDRDQDSSTISEWGELGGTNTSPFNGYIRCISTDHSGNVYVAGELFNINNIRYVAKWNKSTNTWSELGTNTSSFNAGFMLPVTTDVFGNVYACGITRIPLVNDNFHVAKWDGSTWSELGGTSQPSFNNGLVSITTDATGNVYAAGDNIVNSNAPFVAKWNKSTNSWSVLGDSFTWFVDCLITDASGILYAGGEFLNDNGSPYVAKWAGGPWSELGGTNSSDFGLGNITSIGIDPSGNVYAAGGFIYNNGIKNIANWTKNTNTWGYTGTIIPAYHLNSIAIDVSGNLYAAGDLYDSNKKYVSKWDGTNWSDFGNLNANNSIYSLCIDAGGNLYAGGEFTNGNGKYYVAVYYK